jgi:hypothetical protein
MWLIVSVWKATPPGGMGAVSQISRIERARTKDQTTFKRKDLFREKNGPAR